MGGQVLISLLKITNNKQGWEKGSSGGSGLELLTENIKSNQNSKFKAQLKRRMKIKFKANEEVEVEVGRGGKCARLRTKIKMASQGVSGKSTSLITSMQENHGNLKQVGYCKRIMIEILKIMFVKQ